MCQSSEQPSILQGLSSLIYVLKASHIPIDEINRNNLLDELIPILSGLVFVGRGHRARRQARCFEVGTARGASACAARDRPCDIGTPVPFSCGKSRGMLNVDTYYPIVCCSPRKTGYFLSMHLWNFAGR